MRRVLIYGVIFIFSVLFIMTQIVNATSVEITFHPDYHILFENEPLSDTDWTYNNSQITQIQSSMRMKVEVYFSELMDHFTVEGYLYQNNTLIDSEIYENTISPSKQAWLSLGVVWFPLPIYEQMNDDVYVSKVWVNYTVDNETVTEYAEDYHIMKKTFTVISFEYPEIVTWMDHTLSFQVLIHRELSNFTFGPTSGGMDGCIFSPDAYFNETIQPGNYTFKFEIKLPIPHDHGDKIRWSHEDYSELFRYEVRAMDSETNQSLYCIMTPYAVINLDFHDEVFHIAENPEAEDDEDSDLHYYVLGLIILYAAS